MKKEYKITLKEFFESENNLAIHCKTEEEANKLLEAFDKLGKKWIDRDSYLEINCWDVYEKYTCYNNQYEYCRIDYYEKKNYKIYEFDDVDLGE